MLLLLLLVVVVVFAELQVALHSLSSCLSTKQTSNRLSVAMTRRRT
jgi:hypothetical protein